MRDFIGRELFVGDYIVLAFRIYSIEKIGVETANLKEIEINGERRILFHKINKQFLWVDPNYIMLRKLEQ